jgi:hypothetical protein
MADLPEKLWAWRFGPHMSDDVMQGGWSENFDRCEIEYVRADLHTAAVSRADALAAEVERLVNAGNQMRKRCGPRASDGNEWDAALAALRGDANG